MLELGLFCCLGVVTYNYVLYPAIAIVLAHLRSETPPPSLAEDRGAWPTVSFVVAAYNEERVIDRKLRNTLAIDYPRNRFEVIVVSDGSTDSTSAIVATFADQGVCNLHDPRRRGKSSALNRGVARACGEIVVFSDANNDFDPDAVQALVRHFTDPVVGGVCGVKRIKPAEDRDSTRGDGLYWRYESAIKRAEGRLGSITNADGEIFAIRRRLYRPLDERIINDDTQITFDLVNQGYRILYEPEARSWEFASRHIADDFYVKVRMVAGGFQTLAVNAGMFLPPRRVFTIAYFSHKVLRYLAPLPLLGALLMSAALAASPPYAMLLALQFVFYVSAAWGAAAAKRGTLPGPVYVAFYFSAMNLAALLGMLRFLSGRQGTLWRKAAR